MHTERRPCEDAETERTGEDPWKAEAATEAMCPQAKECRQSRGSERDSSPRAYEGSLALLTPRFLTSGLQNCERIHFSCFSKASRS